MVVAHAQAQVIRVAGTIKDDDGRPVRGAAITAENPDHTPAALDDNLERQGRIRFHRHPARHVDDERSRLPASRALQFRRPVGTGRQQSIDVRVARTATPVSLPLDGLKASEIQQRIDRAESLASNGDLDGAIAAWRDVLARE